jgi:hypothetical protein
MKQIPIKNILYLACKCECIDTKKEALWTLANLIENGTAE